MRLVVGPLPASVYWRRRAMVLGGAILAVLLVMISCNLSGKSPAASPSPTASTTASAAASSPKPPVSPSAEAVTAPVAQASTAAAVAAGDPKLCTDAELSVIASPARNPLPHGTEVQINLLIKNVSNRECQRNVGADEQELYLVIGTEKIWSSDRCGAPTGSDDRVFPPGHERSYRVLWNGRSSSICANNAPGGAIPDAGEYQLFGRVGTDRSDAVTLKLT